MRSPLADAAILRGETPITLVTLTMPDGHAIRVASAPVSVSVDARGGGGPYDYDPLLAGMDEFEEEFDVFSLDAVGALTQASLDIVTTEDIAAMQADWQAFTAARVEVAMLWRGESWEQRVRLLEDGQIQNAQIGLVGQATTISVETAAPPAGAMIGDEDRTLPDDWVEPLFDNVPDEMTSLEGCYFQWVVGRPHRVPGYKVGDVAGNNRLILAGHHFGRTGASAQVTVYEDGVSIGAITVVNADGTTGPYAYVADAGAFQSADGAYTYRPTYGGMEAANDLAASALNAGDVFEKLLSLSGVLVDWTRTRPALERLRSWDVGVYGDEPAEALAVVRDTLLPHLPLVEMGGGEGVWFAYVDPVNDPVEAELVAGQNLLGRIGRVETSDLGAVRNSFAIEYAFDPFTREYTASLTLGPDTSTLCYLSDQLYGTRADDTIACDITGDAITAMRILQHRAGRLALPRRIVTYHAAPEMYWLRAGMKVELTDEEIGVSGVEGVITRISRGMRPLRVRIELLDRSPFSRRNP